MTGKVARSSVLVAGLLVICGVMYAHHGAASAYDYTSRITVRATVTDFVWANPHVELYYDLKNDKGENQHWGLEMPSPGSMVTAGVYKNAFKPGDAILISFVGAKESRPFASCAHIVLVETGRKINGAQCSSGLGVDVSKLPERPGYTAVEVKDFPEWPAQAQGQLAQTPKY